MGLKPPLPASNPYIQRWVPLVDPPDWGLIAGWLAEFNSYGTIQTRVREAVVRPENDTTRSRYPLANILTGANMPPG
jgi:hypothetical protein